MTKENLDIAYFISFCIEQYKNEKGDQSQKYVSKHRSLQV